MAGQTLSQGHLWFLGDLLLLHPKNNSGILRKGGNLILKGHITITIDQLKHNFLILLQHGRIYDTPKSKCRTSH
jgi:hypothetical protein